MSAFERDNFIFLSVKFFQQLIASQLMGFETLLAIPWNVIMYVFT